MTENAGTQNVYIQKILLNGRPYEKNFITYKEIVAGGTIEFFMGNTPNRKMADYVKPPLIAE
jgi:putative alpha-1,2-mannosidase